MVSLLDRKEFLRRVRADPPIALPQSPVVMEVIMLVDDGPSAELEDALARMSLKGAGSAFVDWARQRAASRC
jgi:hypothetical protein